MSGTTGIENDFEKLCVEERSDVEQSDGAESDAQCPVCGLTCFGDDTKSVWVCCNSCASWLDFKCTGLKNTQRIPKQFYSANCKKI